MNEADKGKICLGHCFYPCYVVYRGESIVWVYAKDARERLVLLIQQTFDLWPLWGALLVGEIIAIIGLIIFLNLITRYLKVRHLRKYTVVRGLFLSGL